MWNRIYANLINITDIMPVKTASHLSKFRTNNTVKKAYSSCCKAWSRAAKFPTGKNFHVAKAETENLNLKLHQQQMHREASAFSVLKENPKVFYSYLAEKRKVKNVISFLKDETGKSMCDPKEIADLLGKFFESTFVEEPIDEIPSLDAVKISETISDLTFDVLEVKKILKVLNISKSHGPDGIHPKLLKSLSDCPDFVASLTQMLQSCYNAGLIPRIWKDANITALH